MAKNIERFSGVPATEAIESIKKTAETAKSKKGKNESLARHTEKRERAEMMEKESDTFREFLGTAMKSLTESGVNAIKSLKKTIEIMGVISVMTAAGMKIAEARPAVPEKSATSMSYVIKKEQRSRAEDPTISRKEELAAFKKAHPDVESIRIIEYKHDFLESRGGVGGHAWATINAEVTMKNGHIITAEGSGQDYEGTDDIIVPALEKVRDAIEKKLHIDHVPTINPLVEQDAADAAVRDALKNMDVQLKTQHRK